MIGKDKIGAERFTAIAVAVAVLVTLLSWSVLARNVARHNAAPKTALWRESPAPPSSGPHPGPRTPKLYASLQGKKKDRLPINDIDRDNDGVLDAVDLCPDLPGPARTMGCPDSDGDGVADYQDDCPSVPGLAEFWGCPDTDGDSIPDNRDVCPLEAGPAYNNGCPLNALPDEPEAVVREVRNEFEIKFIDSTPMDPVIGPTEALERAASDTQPRQGDPPKLGTAAAGNAQLQQVAPSNRAKPRSLIASPFVKLLDSKKHISEIDLEALRRIMSRITFEQGRIIMGSGTSEALTEFAELLKKHQDWSVVVHCYAAEADNSYRNLVLSQNRGDAIRSHLIRQQVPASRVQRRGYGSQFAPDDTACVSHIDLEIN